MKPCGCLNTCSCSGADNEKPKHYMFFGNLQTIMRAVQSIMSLDKDKVDNLLEEHNWAVDHVATSADDLTEVAEFFRNMASQLGMRGTDPHMMVSQPVQTKRDPFTEHGFSIHTFEGFVFEKKKRDNLEPNDCIDCLEKDKEALRLLKKKSKVSKKTRPFK